MNGVYYMCMQHPFFKALIVSIVIFGAQAAVAAEKLDYTDTLYFTWARVPLGELTLTMKQRGDEYRMVAAGKTDGIALLFNRHLSTTKVEGTMAGMQPIPKIYSSDYVDDGDPRLIAIAYDKKGFPVEEKIVPPREEIRPLVPEEQKRGALDILSGFFAMREKLKVAMANKQKDFSVTIYDGKRLFRVDASIDKPLTNVRFNSIERPAIKLALQRVPLAGYKDKELKKLKVRNPLIALYVEPERLVPFGLSLPVYGAKLEAFIDPKRTARKEKSF